MKNIKKFIPCLLAFLLLMNCLALYGSAEEPELQPIDPATIPGAFLTSYAIIDELVGITDVSWTSEDGFMRAVTTGDNPQLRVYTPSDVNTAEYPYMAVRYRISSDWDSDWMYLADRTYNTGFSTKEGTWGSPKFVCDDQWHNVVFYFPVDFPVMADTDVFCIRLPGADVIGEHLDVAHVAFFKTEEDAARFEGYVSNEPWEEPDDPATPEPIDPATVTGVFFNNQAIVDDMSFTDVKLMAEDGFMRCVTTGGDANIRIYTTALGVDTAEYPYMVIRYRTVADVVDDWMYVASGSINAGFNATEGAILKPQFEKENEWNNIVFNFTTDFPALNGKNVECIRIPCGLNEGDIFDIAHVAFFKTAEDAARFEGYVSNDGCESVGHTWVAATLEAPKTCAVCGETEGEPLTPIDPALVPGISFNNEPANVNRVVGAGVQWAQEDGFLRVTTNGDDAWVGISNLIVNTAEYPYMAIRYRISGDRVGNWLYLTDDHVNTNFSATVGTWGNPKYQIDNQWYTVTYHFPTEFSAMANVNLTGIRLPGAAEKGGYLDIEYIAFFKTVEDVARFTGYPERSECEKNGHTWTDATCTAPKTCSACGATEGEPKGHTWIDATCTAPKTCSACGATEGSAKGHTWADATTEAPKTCTVCGTTEGEPETEPSTEPETESPTEESSDVSTEDHGESTPPPSDETTSAPVNKAPTDTSDKGCASAMLSIGILLVACAGAIALKKKKN